VTDKWKMRRSHALAMGFVSLGSMILAPLSRPQQSQEETRRVSSEVVVDVAAGRVVVLVAKDGVLVGTIGNSVEEGSRLPTPVQASSSHIAVVLGAVEWKEPDTGTQLGRLDVELPQLRATVGQGSAAPHLGSPAGTEAGDLEAIGNGINELSRDLHSKLDVTEGEPFTEVILAGFVPQYGYEVWQLDYGIRQKEETLDYWTTRVSRPSYKQLWPPEKGQPHTLAEFVYPRGDSQPTLIESLRKGDSRLQKVTTLDAQTAGVAQAILAGETNKLKTGDASQFLRAALDAIAPPGSHQAVASLGEDRGFAWVLPPPPEPKALPGRQQADRPAGAPSLRHPPQ